MEIGTVPKVSKINLGELEKYLSRAGYRIIKIEQPWRHVTAVLDKDSKLQFFKLGSTSEISETTINEYLFNRQAYEQCIKKGFTFEVPETYDSGNWKGLFWFTRDYCPDLAILGSNKKLQQNFEKYTPQIAKVLHEFPKLSVKLPFDSKMTQVLEKCGGIKNYILEKVKRYAKYLPENLANLADIVKNTELRAAGLVHSDLKPNHLYSLPGEKLGLVDSEWANNCMPRYYDVANCYQRIFVAYSRPDIADSVLKTYRRGLSASKLEQFDLEFRALMAWRALEYMHYKFKDSSKISNNSKGLSERIKSNDFNF